MADLTEALPRLGVDRAHLHTEVFGAGAREHARIAARTLPPPHPPAGAPGRAGGHLRAQRSHGAVAPDVASLLELAEACDVPTRWSCRTGICHSCESGLLGGAVSYDPQPVDPPAEGNVLVCCAVPNEDVVLDL